MSAFSDYLEDELLDHSLGTGSFTAPANTYLALFTSDPGDDDTGTEVSGGAYARQLVTWNAASGGATDNDGDVTFPIATASWGTVTHMGVYDAVSGGNLLYHAALGSSITIGDNEQVVFLDQEIDISLN